MNNVSLPISCNFDLCSSILWFLYSNLKRSSPSESLEYDEISTSLFQLTWPSVSFSAPRNSSGDYMIGNIFCENQANS